MAGVRNKALKNGKYQGWFINLHGKRKFFTGTHNRKETLRMAERLEDDHLQYAVGYRPLPTPTQANRHESIQAVKQEYLEWARWAWRTSVEQGACQNANASSQLLANTPASQHNGRSDYLPGKNRTCRARIGSQKSVGENDQQLH